MTTLGRFVPVSLAALLGSAACGGDGTGPGPKAASVTGIAGDNQTAPTGGALSFPLSLVALGSGGQPVQGVQVTWSVTPSSGAIFSAPTSTTDVNGTASTNVTAGTFIGNITIHAAVTGVSDVVYHATIVDPCTYLAPYSFGTTVNAILSSADCNRNNFGFYYDFHGLTLPAGQQSIRISMHSSFDTWLDFWSATGPYVAFDDDSILGEAQNSQIDVILPGGNYVIGASSFDQFITGAYSLTTSNRPAAMSGCRQVWVVRGVTVSDSITLGDCPDSSTPTHYYDVARIVVYAGTVLSISQHSTVINPSLELFKVVPESSYIRHLVAANDDSSATNTNAFIRFAVDTSHIYDVIIGTSAGGETGAYTFTVDTTTTLSGRASASRQATPDPWWRQRRLGDMLRRSKP
ncbi:MAG TPA: hypothetical protein VGQ29_12560 [Gemmatimonadales bacterium]|jgi:hypothetical protein|nr:hypothetical protein [Gemmatimonadales bacterium]